MNMTDEGEPMPSEPTSIEPATDGDSAIPERGSILLGIAITAAGHVAACALVTGIGALFGSSEAGVMWLIALGFTQLLHVVPLTKWSNARREYRTTKGVWIAAGITALLNAACFGIGVAMIGQSSFR
jgi:hypothetical protein